MPISTVSAPASCSRRPDAASMAPAASQSSASWQARTASKSSESIRMRALWWPPSTS
nr:hypothetical protein [Propioniciclava coleopterorum]